MCEMGRTGGGTDGGQGLGLLFGWEVGVSVRHPGRDVMQTVLDLRKEIQLETDIWELQSVGDWISSRERR